MKKVVVKFNFTGVNIEQYDKVWEDLRATGHTNPKGLISHVGAEKPNKGLLVVDVWESEEAFNEFGKTLMPLIAKQGIPLVQPTILPARYVYIKQPEAELA